ncbi:MAG: helix-turn-helix domain-containing protein [Candidatus Omnitrophica bacterium]|nr:helix-turn-helix domain-containing protein [Candidatus Omnitrophota bacterium]
MVGSTIQKIRRRKKLTQTDLAQWLGVSRQAVAMWELGKREVKITTLKKIAHVFGVPIEEIITPKHDHLTKKEAIMPKKREQKKKIAFELTAPEAQKVLLTGDFNSWDDNGIVMKRNKSGLWKTNVELDSGVYEYKFIVDNQWWTDPKNDMKVNNPCGDLNSVVEVSA